MKRVVITGMGIVSPVGVGVDTAWNNIINSKSGIVKTSSFNVESLPSHVSGEIPLGSYAEGKWNPEEWVSPKELRRIDKFIAYAIAASKQAMADANFGELTEEEKENFGVHLGAGIGGLQTIYENSLALGRDQVLLDNIPEEALIKEKLPEGSIFLDENKEKNVYKNSYKKISPFFIPGALINLPSGHISIEYGLKGPNLSIVTACATGTHAIGDSYKLIRDGEAIAMVAGGAESSVNPIGVAGFAKMNALSTKFNNDNPAKASRPWDKDRDGFVIAEGAGVLILEEYEHAKARGAKIYAEIVGYGTSGDSHHITAPCADGNGAARCMERALKFSGVKKEDIGYINAHGTSTPLGDKAEVAAIKRVFGDHAYKLSVSSTKSATGHLLGATGAVEAIFSAKALQDGILPPTLNLDNPDEGCDLDFVPHKAKKKDIQYSLSNSFGFGGTNGTLVFKKYSE
ncbi:MAG: beta-ketoacyl-[acyl-carrier-protein] synthase II [Alphaproteobacteria bacterium]|jgi:3-oxoacyl-[acyl-carrier-protein] synthase II|nr:beta-ketoacyl-[acyl-carrier-protein] synthase II [Alphaproteobacteria bacterium]